MEFIKDVMPVLWQMINKNRNAAINVSSLDENLTVNILLGKKRLIFTNKDPKVLLSVLTQFAGQVS